MPDTPEPWLGPEYAAALAEHLDGSPTMPDTLTPERLAELRQMHSTPVHRPMPCSTCETLAHIDALTAAVEELPVVDYINAEFLREYPNVIVDRAAVLAILRGEQ